ncbi:MAG: PIN domain nuclease [Chloroflexi bacterium]|nr:PIN domain nuclease [Chloroflexota bacterium]
MIVVDTSAWIELLRATGSPVHATLRGLLEDGAELATTEVIFMELLAGARDDHQRGELRGRLLGLPMLTLSGLADFEAAADLYRSCRDRGLTLRSLSDCLVAVPAIAAGASVLHQDRDFDAIASVTRLRLVPVG